MLCSIPPPLKSFKQYFLETQPQSIGLYTDCMTRGVVYLMYKHNESESSSLRVQLYVYGRYTVKSYCRLSYYILQYSFVPATRRLQVVSKKHFFFLIF